MDAGEKQLWMRKWLNADPAWEAVRAEELAMLDERKKRRDNDVVFSAEAGTLLPATSSGLVE